MAKATYMGLGALDSNVRFLSTASTVYTLADDDQAVWALWGGQSSAARIRLPAPLAGVSYNIYFTDDAVSSATKITSSGAYDIYFSNIDRVQTTAKAVSLGSTLEGGAWVRLIAINEFRWAVVDAKGSTVSGVNMQSTST